MGGTCDPQLEGAQARAALAATSLDPSRSSAVAPVDHRAWCAEGGCAHTARIRLRDGRGCWWRVSTQSASPHRSSVDGEEVPDHAWAACRRRVLSSCTLGGRRSGVLAEGGMSGRKPRATASRGRIGGVLGACRGVAGDVPGPWPCHWHARISQRRRVGELEPKTVFLGVGGQFHELVKRWETQLRASRGRSGGAPGRAHLVGNAQRARRRLAGLARRAGSGRPNCT